MIKATTDKPDIDVLKDDVAAVKRDLATLVEHLKAGAVGGAQQATSQLGDAVQQLYEKLTVEGARSAETLGKKVEQQPITSVLIAFAIGFVTGRLLGK
jgi:ElaB/YqjD/DUF883 family membrane-anchored ribosome-binding protein